MDILSTIDIASLKDLKESLLLEYGLVIRFISEPSQSFERALSICLFGNEEEAESISSTLNSHVDSSYREASNDDDCYLTIATQIYGITIHIHKTDSTKLYEVECDCPIIHLVTVLLKDGSWIYSATEKVDDNDDIHDVDKNDDESFDDYVQGNETDTNSKTNFLPQFKTLYLLNAGVRKVKADGNCFFRALSDQLSGSQEGHLVLRQLIIDYIEDNREKFEPSIDHQHFDNWSDFISKMRLSGTFVDGIVVAC